MEKRRRFLYVDLNHMYKIGEKIARREPDWFPRLRPRFKKMYKEVRNG